MVSKSTKKKPSITPRKDKSQPLIRQQSTFPTSKDKGKDDTSAKATATHIVPESFSNPANVANSPESVKSVKWQCFNNDNPEAHGQSGIQCKEIHQRTLSVEVLKPLLPMYTTLRLKRNKRNTIDYFTLTLQTVQQIHSLYFATLKANEKSSKRKKQPRPQ